MRTNEARDACARVARALQQAADSGEGGRTELTYIMQCSRALRLLLDDLRDDSAVSSRAQVRADTYKPTAAMAANAKRAIKYREDGEAHGAGTAVGWARAAQLAKRSPVSYDTVKRMLSYFVRHEVDKDSPDWDKPSKGKVMWLAWGGDEGFAWSKAIVEKVTKEQEKQ